MKQQYLYKGPVMEFDRCISDNWEASTYAVSRAQAINNLKFRFKKETNRTPNTKITLSLKHLSVA